MSAQSNFISRRRISKKKTLDVINESDAESSIFVKSIAEQKPFAKQAYFGNVQGETEPKLDVIFSDLSSIDSLPP